MDLIYAAKKVENGETLYPQMYGDPRGYKYNGDPEFYQFTKNAFEDRLSEIYLWSMDRQDLERVPSDEGWIGFLEGNDPEFPERAMQRDLAHIRERVELVRSDPTSAETRLADYLLQLTPGAHDALTNLTLGGYFARGRIWVLHSRLRYFDPVQRRSGLPSDVGALVTTLTDDSVKVTLVNTNQVEAREVQVQAGAYGEHQFTGVSVDGTHQSVDAPYVTVRLEPGCGASLELSMKRYVNQPTLAQPWNRGWVGPQRD